MLSGIILQVFYGILGSWTAYLLSVLYVEYRTRKEKYLFSRRVAVMGFSECRMLRKTRADWGKDLRNQFNDDDKYEEVDEDEALSSSFAIGVIARRFGVGYQAVALRISVEKAELKPNFFPTQARFTEASLARPNTASGFLQ